MFKNLLKSYFFLPLLFRMLGGALSAVVRSLRRLLQHWHRLSHFRQNVIVGVVIGLILHLAHGTTWVRSMEDWALDSMNRLQVDTPLLAGQASAQGRPGYTFIDIDEAAYTAWGEPYHVPRDRLLHLIRYAAEGGAASIIVDVDLSRAGTVAAHDKALADYLASYPDTASPLLLMRTFQAPAPGQAGLPRYRPAYFDARISSARIHWVQPHFERDPLDKAIRRWRLVEAGCLDGRVAWLPSPQLQAVMLEDPAAPDWTDLAAALPQDDDGGCRPDALSDMKARTLHVAGREMQLFTADLRQRVIYSFSGNSLSANAALNYRRLPAAIITAGNGQLSTDPVQGRVVIIGASFAASHDIHGTPVGDMPGALIILNAIKSLQQFGQLQGPPSWVKLLIEAVLVLIMAWAFARFSSLGATLFTGLALVVVLVPVSFYVFRYGIWVDLAAPILGMQIHQLWANYEEALKTKSRLRQLEAGKAEQQDGK